MSWADFKAGASENRDVVCGQTKSFRDIELKTVYEVTDARIVQTTFGTRVIVTIAEKGKPETSHDRWAFPRLGKLFTYESTGDLKLPNQWPKLIGFESRYPDPYKFFYKME